MPSVWLTPLPCSCLCWNITTRSVLAILFEIIALIQYSPPRSISVLFTTTFTFGLLSIYSPIIYVYIHIHMYMGVCICMCMYFFFLCPHYNLLIRCYNNAWNTVDTQIYVMIPLLHSNSFPGLSSGNWPQNYHTFQRYVTDIKECQWLSSFSMRLRAPHLEMTFW